MLAEAVAEGAAEVKGVHAEIRQVPEILPKEELKRKGATETQGKAANVPVCTLKDLSIADAIVIGAPTYLGSMCGQMRQFLDSTGDLWKKNALVGKVGSAFTSSGSQHGGQEAALLGIHAALLHHGMVIVGLPYTFEGQRRIDEVTGGTPYGASTISGPVGERWPSKNELDAARFQGRHVATIALKLFD
jgi:NAD(P)H dehydrogenase (quinone)